MEKIRMLFASIMMLFCCMSANAEVYENTYDFYEDGIYYKYCDEYGNETYGGNTVMVSYIRCQVDNFTGNFIEIETIYSGDVVIPETVSSGGGCTVIGISDYAFYNCSALESVTIPKTVKFIRKPFYIS